MIIQGLVIFTLGEIVNHLGIKQEIIELLDLQGFYILSQKQLVIAFDFLPIPPNPTQTLKYPYLDNARILTKFKIFAHFGQDIHSDFLTSTENSEQALKLLQTALPEQVEQILKQLEILSQSFLTKEPVKKIMTNLESKRAKVELIEYQGHLAVKKTFRPGCERFWKRELLVRQQFSHIRPEIPPLLGYGNYFIISPYYQDIFLFEHSNTTQIPWEIAKQAMQFVYFFYEHGYALIDFYPGNLILDEQLGLKIVDFEFLYRYQLKPTSFIQCYDLAGVPSNFRGDRPLRSLRRDKEMFLVRNYQKDWQPYIGIDLNTLVQLIN